MKNGIDIFFDLIKQSFVIDEVNSNDFDKINLILKNLNLTKEKVIKIGNGSYSNVYKIGNKVLKIGLAKINERIIKHPKIIKTYIKTNILIETKNMPMKIGIEIQDYALPSSALESDLYILYKELRKDGIMWHDIKTANTGYFNNQLVVIDTDYLCYVNETSNYSDKIDDEFNKSYTNDKEMIKNEL